jgi:hypothetical protein
LLAALAGGDDRVDRDVCATQSRRDADAIATSRESVVRVRRVARRHAS